MYGCNVYLAPTQPEMCCLNRAAETISAPTVFYTFLSISLAYTLQIKVLGPEVEKKFIFLLQIAILICRKIKCIHMKMLAFLFILRY